MPVELRAPPRPDVTSMKKLRKTIPGDGKSVELPQQVFFPVYPRIPGHVLSALITCDAKVILTIKHSSYQLDAS